MLWFLVCLVLGFVFDNVRVQWIRANVWEVDQLIGGVPVEKREVVGTGLFVWARADAGGST